MRRGMYIDPETHDLWAQAGSDDKEKWRWVNGGPFNFVPKHRLQFYTELPDWY